jgi:hypothetical protein
MAPEAVRMNLLEEASYLKWNELRKQPTLNASGTYNLEPPVVSRRLYKRFSHR